MRSKQFITAVICVALTSLSGWVYVIAGCGDSWQTDGPDTYAGSCGSPGDLTTLAKTKHWRLFWTDGYERRDAQITGNGACKAGWFTDTECYPSFNQPGWTDIPTRNETWFFQGVRHSNYNDVADNGTCVLENEVRYHFHKHTCGRADDGGSGSCTTPGFDGGCPPGTMPNGSGMCCSADSPGSCEALGYFWDAGAQVCQDLLGGGGLGCPEPPPTFYCGQAMPETGGECYLYYVTNGSCFSPVLVDVRGDGFALTDAAGVAAGRKSNFSPEGKSEFC